jgi:hypothetical protein
MRRKRGRGRRRRPRAGLLTPFPGGSGQLSAGTKTGCPSRAGRWRERRSGGSRSRQGALRRPIPPGSTAPGTEKPRWSAMWRARPCARVRPAARRETRWWRRVALHPLGPSGRGEKRRPHESGAGKSFEVPDIGQARYPDGSPRAAKNRGDGACLDSAAKACA